MNALARTDYAAWNLPETVVSELMRSGAYVFDERLGVRACGELLADVRKGRRFDETLFFSEAEFEESLERPLAGRRSLDGLEGKLDFVERAPQVVQALWSLLGPDYEIFGREVVCLLPETAIPGWVKRRIQGIGDGDLATYVKPELRDISYRARLDLRQEPDPGPGPGEAVTLDVYMHAVSEADGPLSLLEGSHRMAALDTPASLCRTGPGAWRYRSAQGELRLTERALIGDAGFAVLRHGWTLVGDAPGAQHERLSLQYRFRRGAAREAGIDAVNAHLAAS